MKRLFAFDAVRGWVMILMALDHAVLFCYRFISAEGFQGSSPHPVPDIPHFLTRFVSHYCAPSFFFLAGLSVAFYSLRRAKFLNEHQITQKLLKRGIFLIVLQLVVVNFAWGYNPLSNSRLIYFGVLSCIGSGLAILAFARRLPWLALAFASLFLLLLIPFLLSTFPLTDTEKPFLEIALQPNSAGRIRVWYPILPWIGVMGFGCACGQCVATDTQKIAKFFLLLSLLLLLGWLALRLGRGYGNYTPYRGGDWRDFMLMCKYPPSPVFLMWTLGGMSIAIAVHNYFKNKLTVKPFWKLVTLFGQTPLFFYVVHLYLYKSFNLMPFLNGSLARAYVAWLIGLAIMIPLCVCYRSLKKRYPHSMLQYI